MLACATGGTKNRNCRLDFRELVAVGLFSDAGVSLTLPPPPLWKLSTSWLLLCSPAA